MRLPGCLQTAGSATLGAARITSAPYIDLRLARRVHLNRIKDAVSARNKPRLALGRKPYVSLWGELGNAIRHARDEAELRRVWPVGLRAYGQ